MAVAIRAVFFLSGVAGLGYEIVWTRRLAVGLGHELPSLLAVVAAFFGGLAAGAWLLDRPISSSRRPGLWYGGCELAIGGWALATTAIIPALDERLPAWIGVSPSPLRHAAVALSVPALALLPATAAMGATLPAMDRFVSRLERDGRRVGGLYAVNTLGAAAGTLAAAFLLLPSLGFRATLLALAAVNLTCGMAVLAMARGERSREPVSSPAEAPTTSLGLPGTLLATGLLGVGFEVVAVAVMGQVLENTVFSFAIALAVYLLGSVLGAALYQRAGRRRKPDELLSRLIVGTSTACVLATAVLAWGRRLHPALRASFGGGVGGSLLAEAAFAALVFFVPSVLMGATFALLAQSSRRERGGVGRALGVNALGSCLAPAVFGAGLLAWVGAKVALAAVALGYLLLLPRLEAKKLAPAALALVVLPFLPPGLLLVTPLPQGSVLAHRSGLTGTVCVVSGRRRMAAGGDARDTEVRALKVNDRFKMGGTGGAFGEHRQAHIPLLLHPSPRRALFLGVGTGNTMGAALVHPGLTAVGVELSSGVLELLPWFAATNGRVWENPAATLLAADARRYVRATSERFDVVVGDLFHPARDGAGLLYTVEHFRAVRRRLAPGGLFCQWLPLHQLDRESLDVVIRTFLDVFPAVRAALGTFNATTPILALIGTDAELDPHAGRLADVARDPGVRRALAFADLADDRSLQGTLLAGRAALAAFAGDGPLNTDDRPRLLFSAPELAYRQDEVVPWRRLEMLLDELPAPRSDTASAAGGLGDYLRARDLYLRGAIARARGSIARARELYRESVAASPHFRLAATMLKADGR